MTKITEKLIAIQSELKVPKGNFNAFGRYKYRSCEDILESVKPLLRQYALLLTISDAIVHLDNRFYIEARVTLSDESGKIETVAYAREEETKKGMDGSQVTGAASSYARKSALHGLFCLDDTKDSDATNEHGKKILVETEQKCSLVVDDTPKIDFEFDATDEAIQKIDNDIFEHHKEKLMGCKNLDALKGFWLMANDDIKAGVIPKLKGEELLKIKDEMKIKMGEK